MPGKQPTTGKSQVGSGQEVFHDQITSVIVLTDDELEFGKAMQQYMAANHRRFPSFSEVLGVARALGYRKVADAKELPAFVRQRNNFSALNEAKEAHSCATSVECKCTKKRSNYGKPRKRSNGI